MKLNEFKIGDLVKWQLNDGHYEIVASKTIPYPSGPTGPQYPLPPADFMLRKLNSKQEFTHAVRAHLELV